MNEAYTAIRYINKYLECGDNQIVTQTPQEDSLSLKKYLNAGSNDERILCCCLQWQERFQEQGSN